MTQLATVQTQHVVMDFIDDVLVLGQESVDGVVTLLDVGVDVTQTHRPFDDGTAERLLDLELHL